MTGMRSIPLQILEALGAEEVVIIPTDTVYGIAADPTSERAMRRLLELKRRPEGVPVALLVGSVEQASELIDVGSVFSLLTEEHWPGALTIVANKASRARLHIGADESVGVRLPDHELVNACTKLFGPIAASSANRHGDPTMTDPEAVREEFGNEVALIVDGGVLDGLASTVVDITSGEPRVLRQGAVDVDLG
jgi:L-threonylcarbamoyladenylate synthase